MLDVVRRYPAEIQYEWQTRFGLSISSLTDGTMGWDEAYDLLNVIATDTGSVLRARMAGWDYPFSTDSRILADLYDVTLAANSKRRSKKKNWPRPYGENFNRSAPPQVSQDQVLAALEARGFKRRR